jgi:hypothetical protein
LQSWLQQSALAKHFLPSAAHVGCAHVPDVHALLQHWTALWQPLPADSQVDAAHALPIHALLQHS